MVKKNKMITRYYTCKVCNKTHKIKLNTNIVEGRTKFPFPHVFLHDSIKNGVLKELLTILYIDKDVQIRGVEIQELGDDNLFSKEQVVKITSTLMEEIERLREDNLKLMEKINKLKKKIRK